LTKPDKLSSLRLASLAHTVSTKLGHQPDGMGCCADIQLLPAAEQYKPIFEFLIDEEPPFSEEWLNGWEMEDNGGKKQDIFTPCIDNNYTTSRVALVNN
jgi:hypothetical protein